MKIPIAKPYLTKEEAKAAYDVILSGWVTQGPKVQEFEEKFAKYIGTKYAIAVSSCTTALHLSLFVSGIESGDEVICPSMSFIATANSITYCGAIPVFAEVNEDYNINIEDVAKKITNKTKAILIVHQMGMPADIDSFKELCKENNLKLIEDAACAVGSKYKQKRIGSHSDLVCFSFHPRKVITTGEGGMITTNNKEYNERLKRLRQHSMSVNDRTRHESEKIIIEEYNEIGYNFRMTDIQAAFGIKQMEKLDWIINKRREISGKYNENFEEKKFLRVPTDSEEYFTNYQSYSLYLKDSAPISRNELMQSLLEKGISTRRGIMTIHREAAYNNDVRNLHLPMSEKLSDRSILLPIYPQMTEDELSYVITQTIGIFDKIL